MASSGNWEARMGIVLDTSGVDSQIKQVQKVVSQKSIAIKVGSETGTKEMTSFKNALGGVTKEVKVFNSVGEQMASGIKSYSTKVQEATKVNNNLSQSFLDITKKVAKFYASTMVIKAFTTAINEGASAVKEFDTSLIELQKVSDLSGGSLKQYTQDAFDLASQLSTTATNVTDAVTEFSKSGYNLTDSKELAKQALVFQTIADGAISASDSATILIQTMKAYGMTAKDSEKIISSINEVSNNYAVSSTDLSNSIGKVASTANLAGVDLDHLLGLMTSSNEIVQNASKVATGYKSILTNLMTKDLEKQFNEFGLTMRDANGQLKDGYTIIQELAGVYNTLGETWNEDSESMVSLNDNMNKLLEDIGGKYNINTLVSGLKNFDIAIKATNSSINSAGSAQKEYDTALTGINKKIDALKGSFQEFIYGKGGLGDFAKGVIDITSGVLKLINDLGGLPITLLTITSLLITLKGVAIYNSILKLIGLIGAGGLIGVLKTMMMVIPRAIVVWKSFGAGIATTNALIQASIPVVGLLLTAITALTIGYNLLKKSSTKATESISQELDTVKQDLNSATDNVKNINKELDSLRDKISNLSKVDITDDKQLNMLKAQEESLKNQLKLALELEEARKRELNDKAKQFSEEEVESPLLESGSSYSAMGNIVSGYFGGAKEQAVKGSRYYILGQAILQVEAYSKGIVALKKKLDEGKISQEEYNRLYEEFNTMLTLAHDEGAKVADDLRKSVDGLDSTYDSYNNATNIIDKFLNAIGSIPRYATSATVAQNDITKSVEELSEEIEGHISTISDLSTDLTNLSGLYETLQKSQEEYLENGAISLDTYKSLISYSSKYYSSLLDENGEIIANSNAINKVYESKVNEMAIEKAREILDTAQRNTIEKTSFQELSISIDDYADSLWQLVSVEIALDTIDDKNLKQAKNLISQIDEWRKQAISGIGTMQDVGTTTDKTTDSIKSQSDALKDLKSDYERVIDYIKDKLKKEQDEIKNTKDIELKAIDDRIDKLKDEQKAKEEQYDKDIDRIKRKQEKENEYYDKLIEKQKEQNDTISNNIELQQALENLARAKSSRVKVLKDGKFTYTQDTSAVSEAQDKVNEIKRRQAQEKLIADLEKKKETKDSYYQNEIDKLEKRQKKWTNHYNKLIAKQESFKKKRETYYDNLIKKYEGFIKQWEDMTTEYKTNQTKLLASQLTGTNLEKGTWQTRLNNLKNFVKDYNKLLADLDNEEDKDKGGGSSLSSRTITSGKSTTTTISTKKKKKKKYLYYIVDAQGNIKSSGYTTQGEATAHIGFAGGGVGTIKKLVSSYASGVSSVSDNQIAQVGENPNKELVIGSKLNNGIMMSLKRGSGVVNAQSTKTLAGILNTLGSQVNQPNMISNNSSKSITQQFNFGNISLPNVTNGESFAKELSTKFKNYAIQYGGVS